jgi:hypothetical protein
MCCTRRRLGPDIRGVLVLRYLFKLEVIHIWNVFVPTKANSFVVIGSSTLKL